MMIRRRPTYYRHAQDLRDKVQVKVIRKRLKLTEGQLTGTVHKSGNAVAAIIKMAAAR